MKPEHQVVVVGAGPAGIASALALKDVGLSPVVFDQADRIATSWRSRYDSLRLNTWRRFSHLPGRPFPKGTPTFPSRDELIEHLERHAGEDGIELRLGTRVESIKRGGDEWVINTGTGEIRAHQVIVATGLEQTPVVPDWPGRETFEGEVIHSSAYRNPAAFEGQRVLVVGPGSSGLQIAWELAESTADKVWLAVRTPPNIFLRQGPGPVPGDLRAHRSRGFGAPAFSERADTFAVSSATGRRAVARLLGRSARASQSLGLERARHHTVSHAAVLPH